MRIRLWAPDPSTRPEIAFERDPGRWKVTGFITSPRRGTYTEDDFARDERAGWPWVDLCVASAGTVSRTVEFETTFPETDIPVDPNLPY